RVVSVDSLLFRDVNSGSLVAFRADARGNITHGFLDAAPMMVLDKVSPLEAPSLHRVILIAGLLMFVVVILTAIVRFFIRNTPGRPLVPKVVASGRRAMVWAGLSMLAFLASVAAIMSKPGAIFADTPISLKVALTLPVISALLALWAAWLAFVQWRSGEGTIWMRLRHTGAVMVALVFFWSLNTWNLLGWRV
ncbi:MAG: hypothetical protein Q8K82_01135, partial [Gemmatimonadaceae bacterium]|nr:hypothetical protein [Gemmatimonadaceae bacterium]